MGLNSAQRWTFYSGRNEYTGEATSLADGNGQAGLTDQPLLKQNSGPQTVLHKGDDMPSVPHAGRDVRQVGYFWWPWGHENMSYMKRKVRKHHIYKVMSPRQAFGPGGRYFDTFKNK